MNIVILITTKNNFEAKKIARALLEKKLIACANIAGGIKSFFWWQNKIDKAGEVLLILKTERKRFNKVCKVVKSLHSYDIPEVIALPIIAGNRDYMKWIRDSVD